MHKLFLITFVLGVISINCENYCASKLCPKHVTHIACANSGKFYPTCPKDRNLVDLSKKIQLILKSHNSRRNKIANGGEKGFKPASRMATMTWSDELAKLAELNVKQCKMRHDACHATSEYLYAGQNLGLRAASNRFEPIDSVIEKVVKGWYDEVKNAVQDDIDKCCRSKSGKGIGHFTMLVTDRATQVGCAIVTYTNGKWKTSLMACNYSFTNLKGAKVYTSGKAASECTTGANKDYPALCSVDELIEPKPSTDLSLE